MKLLLTGASGLLGSAVAAAAARLPWTVSGIVGGYLGEIAGLTERLRVDLTDGEEVARVLRALKPDAIINCAAISEPALCDLEPVRSEAMNVALPLALARSARAQRCRLIHLSSEQVFDGTQSSPYTAGDPVAPINRYGRQKVASEQHVLSVAGDWSAVVRAPLLMGNSPGGKRGVHERLLTDWAAGRTARLYTDEFRQPCTATNLADVLLELVQHPELTGGFHWAGTELVSRHELGCRIRQHFGLDERHAPIVTVTRADTPDAAAQRQACLALDLVRLPERLQTKPESIATQLESLRVPPSCAAWYARATVGRTVAS